MRPSRNSHAFYMQTCACMNASAARRHAVVWNSRDPDGLTPSDGAAARHRRPDAPPTREHPVEPESLTGIQDEKGPEGYGFGG